MKKLLVTLFAALFAATLYAVDVPNGWTQDINAALARARRENKRVLILFTGSDWCGFCRELKSRMLDKNQFKNYARENFVLVYFDFPRRNPPTGEQMTTQNMWRSRFGIRGYPTVVIIDAEGTEIGRIVGFRSEDSWMQELRGYGLRDGRRGSSRSNRGSRGNQGNRGSRGNRGSSRR